MDNESRILLGKLEERLSTLTETVHEHQDESRAARGKIIAGLEAMKADIQEIKIRASHTDRTVDDLVEWKKVASHQLSLVERWKERAFGAWMIVALFSSAAGAALLAAWNWITVRIGAG